MLFYIYDLSQSLSWRVIIINRFCFRFRRLVGFFLRKIAWCLMSAGPIAWRPFIVIPLLITAGRDTYCTHQVCVVFERYKRRFMSYHTVILVIMFNTQPIALSVSIPIETHGKLRSHTLSMQITESVVHVQQAAWNDFPAPWLTGQFMASQAGDIHKVLKYAERD